MNRLYQTTAMILLAGAGFALGAPQALAQSNAADTEAPSAGGVEEVVVTARKFEENLQQTPVAVTALTSQALDDHRIDNITELSAVVPNVNFQQLSGYPSGATVEIRGLGANPDGRPFVDPGVSTYLDGVIQPRPSQNMLELNDIERIEVLRGPQGTLFGRNTTGGAVNIVTKLPTDEFGFQQKLSYGSENELMARSTLNTGRLFDTDFAAKLVYVHHQIDGYFRNDLDVGDADPGKGSMDAVSGAIHGSLANKLTLDLKADYTHRLDLPAQNEMTQAISSIRDYFGSSPSYGGQPFTIYPTKFVKHTRSEQLYPEWPSIFAGGSAALTWDVSDALAIKSITGLRIGRTVNHADDSGGNGMMLGPVLDPVTNTVSIQPVSPFTTNLNGNSGVLLPGEEHQTEHDQSFSQEVQAVGGWDNFEYAAGLFYFDEHINDHNPLGYSQVQPYAITDLTPLGLVATQHYETINFRLHNQSLAGYGQASWRPEAFDRKLEVTGGLRYTYDKKSLNENTVFDGFPFINRDPHAGWHYLNFNASINYQWTDDIMTYVRVADADQAGGFNPGDANTTSYDPEHALVYEAGFRTEFFDHRLRLNATGFYTDFTDQQVLEFVETTSTVTNAGKSHIPGFEVEATVVPDDHWQFDANIGYVNPQFDEYPYLGTNVADVAHFPLAPKATAHLGAQYTFDEGAFGIPMARVDYSYRDGFYEFALDAQNPFNSEIGAHPYNKLDVHLSFSDIKIGSATGRFELYGENILDQNPFLNSVDFGSFGFAYVAYGRGATYGAAFTIDVN